MDFIVYGNLGLFAIEVKSSNRVRPEDLRGLRAFGDDYPQSRRYLLYQGEQRLLVDGVLCMPCDEFLRGLHPEAIPE